MAQWNPYFGNASNSMYEDQNIESPVYNLPYNLIYPSVGYNDFYLSNNASNFGTNLPTMRTAQEIEAQQFNQYYQAPLQSVLNNSVQNQFTPYVAPERTNSNEFQGSSNSSSSNNISSNNLNQTVLRSNLTPTAAEFKPSSSQYPSGSILSQTFSNNNYKAFSEEKTEKTVDVVDKNKNKNTEIVGNIAADNKNNGENSSQSKSKPGPFMKFTNKKSYNRNDSGQNYSNDRYNNKSRDIRDKGYKSNNHRNFSRDDFVQNSDDSTRFSNGSVKYSNSQRDNSYGSKNSRYNKNSNGESSYYRNYQENSERSNENSAHSVDKYRNSNSKNSYRNSYKEENKYENWRSSTPSSSRERQKDTNNSKNNDKEKYSSRSRNPKEKIQKVKFTELDDISQRDRLIEQVSRGTLECLVCCELIRQVDRVWSCQKCYHIFHLHCSLKWAKTSKDENGWRCPACQHVCAELPSNYTCYCGQVQEPVYRFGDIAHSCGSVCGRKINRPDCPHRCKLLCHPGPCPTCEDLISKSCNCGATKQIVKCSADIPLVCKGTCGKPLNCGVHYCQKICHPKECDICLEIIQQDCYCGKANHIIPCTKDQIGVKNYSCNQICDKLLPCGNHRCQNICHPGDCQPCAQAVEIVKSCPCGKTELEVRRISCLDPIPCCEKVCGKRYLCGQPSNPHICQNVCHEGDCPPCPLTSLVLCRCGHMSKEISCSEMMTRADDARCEKRCTKKRSCAKHRCNQLCCIDVDHICPLPCTRTLSCGQHRCEHTCHKGHCQPCWRTSFEELYCECGASVIYPPITCGTKRPPCSRPCTRDHGCSHVALHNCHSQPDCPPCTVLTTKWCHGGHEKRTTIPCHQKDFSCGLPCNRELPCGRHKCQLPCHLGPCLKEGQVCVQLCTVPRETCGHNCGLPCHDPPCQESPCKEMVRVMCECGLRSTTRACVDMAGEYQRIANSLLASKMADMQLGHTIDISDIQGTTRKQVLRTLECNDECHIVERNRRLAIGLQIRNPDLSQKLTPRYSDFMKQWAKKDPRFCQMVHDKLTELVQLAKQSKQKSRSYSFDSMNRDKRHFIHEYCEHFGCESAAYDQEPNRNVVATAARDKAWLPSISVLELLQRESGQRKVPGPILNRPLGASKGSGSQSVSLKITSSAPRSSFSSAVQRPKTPEGETIDYFDYDPTKKFR